MNISKIPHDCLIQIFSHGFTLQDLIRYRIVCWKWKVVIEEFFCQPQKSLKLFESRLSLSCYDQQLILYDVNDCEHLKRSDNDKATLVISIFNKQVCNFLAQLFPSIQKLMIYVSHDFHVNELFHLLSHWKRTITTLSFIGWSVDLQPTKQRILCLGLNKLSKLKRLDLLVQGVILNLNYAQELMRRILHQLEQFSCHLKDDTGVLGGLGPNCSHLRLYLQRDWPLKQMNLLTQNNGTFLKNVKHLHLINVKQKEVVLYMCSLFTELQYFGFSYSLYGSYEVSVILNQFILSYTKETLFSEQT